jgi:hypothetical protein
MSQHSPQVHSDLWMIQIQPKGVKAAEILSLSKGLDLTQGLVSYQLCDLKQVSGYL